MLQRRIGKEIEIELGSVFSRLQTQVEHQLMASDEYTKLIDEQLAAMLDEPPSEDETVDVKHADDSKKEDLYGSPRISNAEPARRVSTSGTDIFNDILNMTAVPKNPTPPPVPQSPLQKRASLSQVSMDLDNSAAAISSPKVVSNISSPTVNKKEIKEPEKDETSSSEEEEETTSSSESSVSTGTAGQDEESPRHPVKEPETSSSEMDEDDMVEYNPGVLGAKRRRSSKSTPTETPTSSVEPAEPVELYAEVFRRGQKLAAYVSISEKDDDEEKEEGVAKKSPAKKVHRWVIVIVKSFDPRTGLYTCRDPEAHRGSSAIYEVSFENLEHFNHKDGEFHVGDHVLALYRAKDSGLSSVFYRATVTSVSKNIVHVRFEDGDTAILKYNELFKDPHLRAS